MTAGSVSGGSWEELWKSMEIDDLVVVVTEIKLVLLVCGCSCMQAVAGEE